MITAGVQQALQTVDIPGASPGLLPSAPAGGGEFRDALAATVGDVATKRQSAAALTPSKEDAAGAEQLLHKASQSAGSGLVSLGHAQTSVPQAKSLPAEGESAARAKGNSNAASKTPSAPVLRIRAQSSARASEVDGDPLSGVVANKAQANAEAARYPAATSDGLETASLRGGIDVAEPAPGIEAEALDVDRSSRLQTASDSLPVAGAVKAKEPAQTIENANTSTRKSALPSLKQEAVAEAIQTTSPVHSSVAMIALDGKPQTSVPSAEASQAASKGIQVSQGPGGRLTQGPLTDGPLANEPLIEGRLIEGRFTKVQRAHSDVTPIVAEGRETTRPTSEAESSSAESPAAVNQDSRLGQGGAQPVAGDSTSLASMDKAHTPEVARGAAVRTDAAIQPEVTVAGVTPFAGVNDPVRECAGRVEDQTASQAQHSIGVSERVPVSGVTPATTPSSGMDRSIRQQRVLSSTDGTTSKSVGIRAGQADSSPAIIAATDSRAAIAPHSARSLGAALSAEPASGLKATKSTSDSSVTAATEAVAVWNGAMENVPGSEQMPQPAELRPVGLQPAGLQPSAIAGAQTAVAEAKDRAGNRQQSVSDAVGAAQQSAPSEASSVAAPTTTGVESRDAGASAAPVAGSGVTLNAVHQAVTAGAVPVHPTSVATTGATGVSAGSAGVRTDARLDAALAAQPSTTLQSGESHRTLLATPTALEVGVQSGTQGWLKIRAEVGGQGEVKASLDAVSSSGRDLLHSQLPALNAFLHGEQMTVTASVADRSSGLSGGAVGSDRSSMSGSADGSGSSAGSFLQGDGGQRAAQQHLTSGSSEVATSYDSLGVTDSIAATAGLQAGPSVESGRWLNVRV